MVKRKDFEAATAAVDAGEAPAAESVKPSTEVSPDAVAAILAADPAATVSVPTKEEVVAAGYTEEAAAKIVAEQKEKAAAVESVKASIAATETLYRVKKKIKISLEGQVIVFNEGFLIDPSCYGTERMNLIKSCVELEKVV